jgi:hypothetical protein
MNVGDDDAARHVKALLYVKSAIRSLDGLRLNDPIAISALFIPGMECNPPWFY